MEGRQNQNQKQKAKAKEKRHGWNEGMRERDVMK